ncbi:unnamed protein product, partial [Amoebophrya sp. A25]
RASSVCLVPEVRQIGPGPCRSGILNQFVLVLSSMMKLQSAQLNQVKWLYRCWNVHAHQRFLCLRLSSDSAALPR